MKWNLWRLVKKKIRRGAQGWKKSCWKIVKEIKLSEDVRSGTTKITLKWKKRNREMRGIQSSSNCELMSLRGDNSITQVKKTLGTAVVRPYACHFPKWRNGQRVPGKNSWPGWLNPITSKAQQYGSTWLYSHTQLGWEELEDKVPDGSRKLKRLSGG